jgi:hypothetical protein
MVNAGWDDVPHLTADVKRTLLSETQPFLRDARSKGIPSLGAGAVYPIEEDVFLVDPFPIPTYWPRAYGLDVGWNKTAAIWGAIDRDTETVYLYAEHYRGQAEPSIHATAIKARGDWIPGVIDPASVGANQRDGERLIVDYRTLGLKLHPAENSVEAGIQMVYERLSVGKIKVFKTLGNWRSEHRLYRRHEKNGSVIKEHDHLMDAMRYLIVSGLERAIVKPIPKPTSTPLVGDSRAGY